MKLEENLTIHAIEAPTCSTDSIDLDFFDYPNQSMWTVTAVGDSYSFDAPTYTYCNSVSFSFWVDVGDGNSEEQAWIQHDADTNQITLEATVD